LKDINECVDKQDTNSLFKLLKSKISPFKNIVDENVDYYMEQLIQEKESKLVSIELLDIIYAKYVIYKDSQTKYIFRTKGFQNYNIKDGMGWGGDLQT
jgi:hypothetical protein